MDVQSSLESFSRGVIRNRWLLLGAIALVTVALVSSTKDLVVNNDYDNWLPAHDKVSELYRLVDRQFSSTALVFTVLDCTEKGVFHPDSLALIRRMTAALEGIDELFNVSSLTNILDIRKTEAGIEVGDLIPEIPRTREEVDALQRYVLSKEMYVNALVSSDAAYTVLIANIKGSSNEAKTAEKVLGTIREVAGDHPYYFGGDPALVMYADLYMEQDLASLVPVMLFVMVGILAMSFRRFWGVVLPLGFVFLCILWTFGFQALLRISVNVLTPAVVVLLIALGSDYSVYIYHHYLRRGDVEVATAEMISPVTMSALTTIAGLLTFGTTRIDLLQFFGVGLAFGLGSACLLAIVLLPILIRLFRVKPAAIHPGEEKREDIISRALTQVGMWFSRNAKGAMAVVLIGLIVMGVGIPRITTNVDYVEFMPKDSPPRVAGNILRDHFSGFYPVSIYFRGDMEDPALMQMESYLENHLRSYEMTGGFRSISGLIAEANWLMNGVFAVPETREGIANLWLLLEGEDLLRTFVAPDRQQSLITALIQEPQTDIMRDLAMSIWNFIHNRVSGEVVRIDPARLSPGGLRELRALQFFDAAEQVAWLAQAYDNRHKYDPNRFLEVIRDRFQEMDRNVDLEPVWDASRAYLRDEALEILPPEFIDHLMTILRNNWQRMKSPELRDDLTQTIVASQVMNPEDAATTAVGVLGRAESAIRLQRAAGLMEHLFPLLSPELRQDKDFRKRAAGVLWRLWAEEPVFFSSQVASIPDIDRAKTATTPLEIQQAGFADLVRHFYELLHSSQIQSLILASVAVWLLVSLTQFSLRRGLISFLSVVVPLGYVLGLMGWTGIPLDFGTALAGALIMGLGVDGSIHFLHLYHRLRFQGMPGDAALRAAMGHVGKSIVTANGTTFSGFLVLLLSKTSVLKNFGLVNCMAIFLVTVSILTLLPALITVMLANERGNRAP